jgi:hypothetical protein
LEDLAKRARGLQENSPTGSLQSLRTVLTALVLSASEAVELLPDEPASAVGDHSAFDRSLGAVGAYLVHSGELAQVPLGQLIADHFARDEAELAEPARRSSG